MDVKQAKELARASLGDKRYQHTLNVRDMAIKLAKRYGADPEKAALAALLHDCAKERPREELLQIIRNNAIIANNAENRPAPVWHGVCAAILARTQWGVTDEEVLSAIACHTTGKPGMGQLDKIVFLADMISKERDYPGVDKLRKLARADLDKAVLAGLSQTVDFVNENGKALDPMSAAAYADLVKQNGGQKE